MVTFNKKLTILGVNVVLVKNFLKGLPSESHAFIGSAALGES